ncbi:hypothetical protein J437_LFUL012354 [Ladona fulva]|uniref:Peptidoglycan recognition protein family domain-containing protein n=1 Tax=Ladona fulva TaxID=123851 RepID=A0A8K0K0W2_LADFU|nr:hypothetical protein J437_LFUL012354 [Ladona fulva]
MYTSLISSIFALVFGVAGCSLLLFHLLSKNQAYRSAAWLSLGLGCAAVLSSATVLTTQEKLTLNNCAENQTSVSVEEEIEREKFSSSVQSTSVAVSETKIPNGTILDRRGLVVVSRRNWVALLPKSTTSLRHPVEYVVLSQTATEPCTTQAECTLTVRYLQVFHVEGKKWMDIAYNFLVAGDGQAYEGRGWDVEF